ncbi:hypothetical protein CLV98_105175 [Dyadobacter jejuensis]|uniref:Uncharacterized protein n=1 Tax=Dyadobacter jejuensis TaxID=1082580 RepID=A0A316AJJ5_9BACT|nr:hypothetical protein CLV98_105175 [Dyadobacter jejuensis]
MYIYWLICIEFILNRINWFIIEELMVTSFLVLLKIR